MTRSQFLFWYGVPAVIISVLIPLTGGVASPGNLWIVLLGVEDLGDPNSELKLLLQVLPFVLIYVAWARGDEMEYPSLVWWPVAVFALCNVPPLLFVLGSWVYGEPMPAHSWAPFVRIPARFVSDIAFVAIPALHLICLILGVSAQGRSEIESGRPEK